jgi:hypothetical protein
VTTEHFRTLAYVSLRDDTVRDRVVSTLDAAGWTAIEQPTGYHVLRSMADVIEGDETWRRPGLIVIDAFARGCAGTTIALGLRDLGIEIPIVLVTAVGQPAPITSVDPVLHVVDSAGAERAVAAIVRSPPSPFPERDRYDSTLTSSHAA